MYNILRYTTCRLVARDNMIWQDTILTLEDIFTNVYGTTELWNGLTTTMFPGRFDMVTFRKRVYLHLRGWQRTCSSSGVARGRGGGNHLPSGDPNARLP